MAFLKLFNSRSLLTLILLAGLTACGGGGGSGGGTATGVFLDSAVQGMTYVSGSITGLTDTNGTFQYEVGNSVTFQIGDIFIGQARGSPVVTPVTLVPGSDASDATVLNIVSFLLTLV